MYTRFQLAKKYLHYYLTASNGKGHGVHSPFVFDFIKNVLNDKKDDDSYDSIEKLREELLHDKRIIEVEDYGAGSAVMPLNKRVIKDIADSSLKTKKFAQLLFRIAQYYKSQTIVELGTSLGITTLYLGAANKTSEVFTLEGSKNVAAVAQSNFQKPGLQNIKLLQGNFDDTLPALLSQIQKVDLAFVDGNHRKLPTLNYFDQLINKSTESTILIFDDIHWSAEMEAAWKQIQQHPAVTLTIDLFFIGLVFFRKDFKAKQHFVIRF
ncbi:MAG: Methyltransferase domain protein [Chitinophagaceae bacterium]|nr:Methyltransferase domain protein [Chitinophagaceae bacterium]